MNHELPLGGRLILFPPSTREDEHAGVEQGLSSEGAARPEGDDGCHAVGEEGSREGDAGGEVLADEEVAVVEGGGVNAEEKLVWARGGG